ncbi:hypothetical protein BC828DRAFT_283077 [Blastocladiella britannica]|nr:hypothetical protein BC828DRAFT_283077 [Blastocladiella britannica]
MAASRFLLLPDELLVRVSTYLGPLSILALRATSRCLFNLNPNMLKHKPDLRALMAIVRSGTASGADTIFRAPKNLADSRKLVVNVVFLPLCHPHRNRRHTQAPGTPENIRDLVRRGRFWRSALQSVRGVVANGPALC